MRFRFTHILLILFALLATQVSGWSQSVLGGPGMSAAVDSLAGINPVADSISADTIRFNRLKSDLDHIVTFQAKDSVVLWGQNEAHMYGSSQVDYGEISLTANKMRMNMDSTLIYATGLPDSVGEMVGTPVFKDRSGSYASKTMKYNYKSQRGYITDIVTEQGEGYLTGGITKKTPDNQFYICDGQYTTCDNHDHPHFYFQITKAKMRPKKDVVTGPVYMVLEDLPLPIALPFAFFPFTDKYSSGVLMPTFGEDYNRGFYLRNGGYYLALNRYMDLALTGEIYTGGSWGLNAQSRYTKRYRYSGNFNIGYLTTVTGTKGDPDYSKMHNFQVVWSHSQDRKANPNMSFSASVNFATSGYSRNNLDDYYRNSFTENTKSSSVNFTYNFPNSKWSLSATANVSQRSADSTLTISFPNFTLTMSQINPFRRKNRVGDERWYEKIQLSYSGRFQNSITAKQNEILHKSFVKDWRNAFMHSVPISANFSVLKYINVTPSISMNDRMYSSKIRRSWDPNASTEVMDTTYGFYNVFDFNASVSLNTKLYGFANLGKLTGGRLKTIRHVITPSVSFSASPDFSSRFWGYYGQYSFTDATGKTVTRKYPYFRHGLYGTPGEGKSGVLSFNIANNLEAKVRSDEDSTGFKKISLIENLSLSQSYNMAADSLRWSNLNTSIMLRLTRSFNLNLSATWDVYRYGLDANGNPVRINKLRLLSGGGWGRLASTGTSFSYTFNNDTFRRLFRRKGSEGESKRTSDQGRDGDQTKQSSSSGIDMDADGYAKWSFPWSLTMNYSLSYGYGEFDKQKMEYRGRFSQNLSFNGNIQPAKGWGLSFSASYNFDTKQLAYMNCSVTRQMHCFVMSASFVPVGPYKSYNFHIAVKSSILSDVKYDKRSSYNNGVEWF